MTTANSEQVPVNVVGSSTFGIYPKISIEKTVNMYISDGWLVNYAGYQLVRVPPSAGEGRGIFNSIKGNFLIAVIGNAVYKINNSLVFTFLGTLETSVGEVYIDENLNRQICIVDGLNAYLYDYGGVGGIVKKLIYQANGTTRIIPGYVTYHNTFFLFASNTNSPNPSQWYAFAPADLALTTPIPNSTMELQTKPDSAIAIKRIPGGSNNVIVLGETVAELWAQVGGTVAYQRISSFSMDNGCVSVATLASNESFVCWLGQNESSGPAIVYLEGSNWQRISTDGIDHLLGSIQYPDDSTAFIYRENGHVFYQLTFFNEADNLSLVYDFNTKMFFHVCDENQNFYPTRQLVYFNEANYFISLNDSNLYQMGQKFVTYNYNINSSAPGDDIPRIRICKTIRKTDSGVFRAGMFTFWLEQGVNQYSTAHECSGFLVTEPDDEDEQYFIITEADYKMITENGGCSTSSNPYYSTLPAVDMCISKNGNQSFSNNVRHELNPMGLYKNQIRWYRMGQANELTIQLRFWGLQRFVANNGVCEIY